MLYSSAKNRICFISLLLVIFSACTFVLRFFSVEGGIAVFAEDNFIDEESAYNTVENALGDTRALPVIMYHQILKEVIRFVNDGGELAEKPVMITFEDGQYKENLLCDVFKLENKFALNCGFNREGAYSATKFLDKIEKSKFAAASASNETAEAALDNAETLSNAVSDETETKKFIKWVDFNVTTKVLKTVYSQAKKYYNADFKFDIVEVLSYLSVKNGNKFNDKTDLKNLDKLIELLKSGKTVESLMENNKYYPYYFECYQTIFSQFFTEKINEATGEKSLTLNAYFPLARGHWYTHYDDFGSARTYGFKRRHLGHDMNGSVGAPIIAIEGGTVKELGWNKYGGWRIGILSNDGKRYYYYAHLRKDKPFKEGLKAGDCVSAGEHIGYLGKTGYSATENTNLKSGKPHLHLGMQLIFDESQIEGNGEIWIDLYAITNLLSLNRAAVN